MGRDTLIEWDDDMEAWSFLESRGYTMHKGVIKYRPEKAGCMPEVEGQAIDYLCGEWDWAYE